MKKKTNTQKKLLKIKKEDFKKITSDEFDSAMRTILSVPSQTKKKKNEQD